MNIQQLDWDSNFFGIKVGKIEIFDEETFNPMDFKEQAINDKYDLIYVFKYGQMLSWSNIQRSNIEFFDIMLTMSKEFKKMDFIEIPYELRTELSKKELNDCYKIAEQISNVSRFFNEPKIGIGKTKKLYRKWVDNAINQFFADGLFIEKSNNSVCGIHLVKTDYKNKTGCCAIIGVNSKYKGLGIGEKLWNQSFGYWANEKDIEKCIVPFSLQNKKSFNFHLKMGFNKIEEIKYIYHFRNKSL